MAVAVPGDRRRGPLKLVIAVLVCLAMCVGAAGAGHAAPKPSVKKLRKELKSLQKSSDTLISDYYAGRIELQKVEKAEKAARRKLGAAQAVYDRESAQIRLMAVQSYTNGGLGLVDTLLGAGGLNGMAIVQQLANEQNARLHGFAEVRDTHLAAKREAGAKADDLRARLKTLDGKKRKAEKVIEQIKDRIDLLHDAPGARSDGTFVPQLPAGADNITPRMRLVKQLIAERFGVPYGIGCYRSLNDGGEHPLGRACDFMLSRGGAMPSGAEIQRGHEISAWVIKNAKRLGIMYVIYRQRIWHVRTGTWRVMSNRGGTTANHYDHPHISVY